MGNSLEEKVKSAKLTKVERIIAEYLLNNLSEACFLPATDVALAAGVSDSSVIRLSRSLGFRGYTDMQRHLQEEFSEKANQGTRMILSSMETLSDGISHNYAGIQMKNLLDLTMKNLKSTIDNNSEEKIRQLTDMLVDSRNKHIFGSRVSSASALYFGTRLSHYIRNVFVTTTADTTAFERMMDATEEDCLILFSFEKHTEISQAMAEAASKSGAKIAVLTDNVSSPLLRYADLLILISDESINLFPSLLPFSFIAEVILACVYQRVGQEGKKRYRAAGAMTKQLDKGKFQL